MNAALSLENEAREKAEELSAELDSARQEKEKWVKNQDDYEVLKHALEGMKAKYDELDRVSWSDYNRACRLQKENEELKNR